MYGKKFRGWCIRLVLGCILSFPAVFAVAEDVLPFGITENEYKLLPQACYARLMGDRATQKMWESKIGYENFLHVHHFCFGLNFINRAKFTTVTYNKRYYLNQAVANFAYVLKNWPANSVLRPDAEAGMREAQMMLSAL